MANGQATKKGVRDLERCINLIIEKVYFYLNNQDSDEYAKEYPWYKKMLSCIDSKKRVIIGEELVEQILDDCKKDMDTYQSMYL
jgi:hypothetical protein